ncbi:uncharacterized protein PV06_01184 [Exophiala oligosperma]|uniref:Uncharacterized protein n=1 Tax=Exophiala oligosperma TaxID=215243 RepID=A0A0D2DZQ4_9EURO|nr:uncharacterized protein PV06_01184 [Exophiala oligosperma]KIW48613.1 hypothetical protein PV06_01184 [Exophiala oligosperma]
MASARAQAQLNKRIDLDIPGTIPSNVQVQPVILANHPPQPPFPAYNIGYNVQGRVQQHVHQNIPARPPPGRGSAHPYYLSTEANLHPILFQLEPAPSPLANVDVPLLVNAQTGQVEVGPAPHSRPLRYFWHLPRWVDVDVPGHTMELWLRLDPRVRMADILDRINVVANRPNANVFNMRRSRFRDVIHVPAFDTVRRDPGATEVEMIGRLTREQVLLNTAMRVDLCNNRLLMPVLDNTRSTRGFVDSRLPIDHFIRAYALPIPIPSDRQVTTLALRHRMQTLAVAQGHGKGATAYNNLHINMVPPWWHRRPNAQPARIAAIDNLTHREWMDDCLNRHPGVQQVAAPARRPLPPPWQPQTQQPQRPPPAAGVQHVATNANRIIDPRLQGGNPPAAFPGLFRPGRPNEPEESRHSFTTPDGVTHYYVEPQHRHAYR